MASWKALNVESDDESDVDIDDTKELQIEDALKLYQTALKYHAAGPPSYEKAQAAYEELFASDIFKYPESQPELQRIELYGPLTDDELWQSGSEIGGALVAAANLDAGPSTLPQILHLSHKNFAQFRLEYLSSKIEDSHLTLSNILADASTALDHFVQALDKDDSDLDLWRKTATVGNALQSQRLARFCLEAVLDGDEEPMNDLMALPGLEEALAGEQLRSLISTLADTISILQSPLFSGRRKKLSKMLGYRLDPFQRITEKTSQLAGKHRTPMQQIPAPQRLTLKAPTTWAEMGDLLLKQSYAEQHGSSTTAPAPAIAFDTYSMPTNQPNNFADVAMTLDIAEPSATAHTLILPTTIDEQFPGLDFGKPTAQPQIAPADPSMSMGSGSDAASNAAGSPTMTLVTRKRSNNAAGLQDEIEEGRTKSKRIRKSEPAENRQALIEANIRWEHEQQLNEIQAADDWMFETVANLFERIGVIGFEKAKDVRQEVNASTDADSDGMSNVEARHGLSTALSDIWTFLSDYNDQLAYVLLQKSEDLGADSGLAVPGAPASFGSGQRKTVSKAPEMPVEGLMALLEKINNDWQLVHDVAFEWLSELLRPASNLELNSYARYEWSEALKTNVVRALVNFDDSIFERVRSELVALVEELSNGVGDLSDAERSVTTLAEMIQTIFELHLDIYTLIKQANSGVDAETVAVQGDRMQRWLDMAREGMLARSEVMANSRLEEEVNLRFLWTIAFAIAAAPDISQDHVIECLADLKAAFVRAGEPSITLQNNAVMPELSLAALDRELSKLTTKDFFLKVTSQDVSEPVEIIESLEPLLGSIDVTNDDGDRIETQDYAPRPANPPTELVRILQGSSLSIRLLLWQRLRNAYSSIDYQPMVAVCYFKMMRMLLDDLLGEQFTSRPQAERQLSILKTMRILREMLSKLLAIMQASDDAFECLDAEGLKAAVTTLGKALHLLQVFNVYEDSLRIGQSQPPTLASGLPVPSFANVTKTAHETQLHCWMILYGLLREAISESSDLYPTPVEDKFDFLRCVHRNLGLRGFCGGSNRILVRMLKDEFQHMTHVEGYDSEQAQVLYDLYGLNCFLNPSYELIEHHCKRDAWLDKGAAMLAVDLLLSQASKLPVKELVKHPLKDTIEKVHGSVPRKKSSETIQRNMEIYRSFLRSPINPIDLYTCLRGDGNELPIADVPKEDALLASKGWYFLMGHLSLTKFRTQKRTGPVQTEDLDIAIAFFMQDLQFSAENWETWFRLAQAYDTKIEEAVVWTAEKLNNNMSEIVSLQRSAIHSYTMATALMHRSANLAFETSDKMTELYADFATRLYASSREPYSMLPFALDEEKWLSRPSGMGKGRSFAPLRVYTAWKLAKVLYQRAIAGRPRSWMLQYMLGKCLWKMHDAPEHVRQRHLTPTVQDVLEPLVRAIELIPDKKDSREKREPVLEPHYKLLSIVHKLVSRRELSLSQAERALQHTAYARIAPFPREMEEWVAHVLSILKNLRAADKSNWHHRMIARSARIIYEESRPRGGEGITANAQLGALGAKHELTQQMFTKTMVLQVWRPESERAGRHFVYTARYTRFFTSILEQLRDRANLEQLARRVRRKPTDIFEHSQVWQEMCNAYLRLLRRYADLSEGLETSTFSNIAHDDFLARKEPLEKWMQAQDTGASAALDVLREVQELKKINQGLMKPGPIDDLIGDAYANLFNTIGKHLWEEERRLKAEEEARRPPPPVASAPRNPMMSLTSLMNLDGAPALMQPSAPVAEPVEQLPQRKKIGVGRREIRTCAEACSQKASAATLARQGSGPRVQVVIDNSRGYAGDVSVETSAPGSIHDSADDESELSELEEVGDGDGDKEEAAPKPRFPGLAPSVGTPANGSFPVVELADGEESADDGDNDDGDVDMDDQVERKPGDGLAAVAADETKQEPGEPGVGDAEAL